MDLVEDLVETYCWREINTVRNGLRNSLLAIDRAKLAANAVEMKLDCALADAKLERHILSGLTMRREPQALQFPRTERKALRCRSHSALDDCLHEQFMKVDPKEHNFAQTFCYERALDRIDPWVDCLAQ